MDGAVNESGTCIVSSKVRVDAVTKFLTAIFGERDLVLFRPIETWTEGARKSSRVIYDQTRYFQCVPDQFQVTMPGWLHASAEKRANVFFGVCPRFGNSGRFDLAWQIRTVRCLWSDIDHITVGKAIERCEQQGLPPPSLAVNSGSGVHLYWLLDEPYKIDDVGDPPPVLTEWIERPGRPKKPRRYILEGQDRAYLDQRRHISKLSSKAQQVQNILAGIATLIGGDHTTDLSRLLRVPGTLNRKDERNGRTPLNTELVVCEPTRRYAIAEFDRFAKESPTAEVRRKICSMPLPGPRKLTAPKADKFAELVAASAIAPAGNRSEADFAVCCYAIRNGIPQSNVWAQVSEIGKFAEEGERYFNVTWENAAHDVREGVYERLQKRTSTNGKHRVGKRKIPETPARPGDDDGSPDSDGDGRPTIPVEPSTTPVSTTMSQITARLLAAGDCYSRADQFVAIRNDAIAPVLNAAELAGLLNHYVEFFFVAHEGASSDRSRRITPIPGSIIRASAAGSPSFDCSRTIRCTPQTGDS